MGSRGRAGSQGGFGHLVEELWESECQMGKMLSAA